MKKFLDENFLLQSKTAQRLYHEFAREMPIIDYHCHLPPAQIASDHQFKTLTEAWLYGDHYKWRAMRANGIDESYSTGNKSDYAKFEKWAETLPCTLRNPLYHWTHLELQRYFNITKILNPGTAKEIYEETTALLQTPAYSVRNLLRRMNVKVICTTDDPADDLSFHRQMTEEELDIKVLPAFRPDNAMQVDNAATFNAYISRLESASGMSVSSYSSYLDVLKQRHDFFASMNCTVSDHGLEQIYAEDYTEAEIEKTFLKIRAGQDLSATENLKLKSALLYQFAVWDFEKGWVQQYHLGALRNNNSRLLKLAGADTGCDSIGDFIQARALSKFLDRLDSGNQLTKTILYNLNPSYNELIATMAGNFNDGTIKGKIQYGSAWWFLDQKDGMVRQINALSNMGLLSRFVGMITDSRSFLSYPRHEYFRRILCNLFGEEIENGELPDDINWTGSVIRDICFNNAKNYFNWQPDHQPALVKTAGA
ncbi:MAG: glucuronate isomerase [Sphingobacteriales bacterium]|nr:glucuronate isomerase [Sphingobacteriales bacterium]